jgi:hypothetical protein
MSTSTEGKRREVNNASRHEKGGGKESDFQKLHAKYVRQAEELKSLRKDHKREAFNALQRFQQWTRTTTPKTRETTSMRPHPLHAVARGIMHPVMLLSSPGGLSPLCIIFRVVAVSSTCT